MHDIRRNSYSGTKVTFQMTNPVNHENRQNLQGIKGDESSACLKLTSDTLQPNLDDRHEIFCQSVDFITLRKESVRWEFMTIYKVIIRCAASCRSDKLKNVNLQTVKRLLIFSDYSDFPYMKSEAVLK